jgi:exonuclease SbcC
MNHRLTEIDCTLFQKVLVVGKNVHNDLISNGVGKTTIFSSIEYACFNQVHSTTLDKIVRDGNNKAIVEYDFILNNEIYRIYRHRTKTGTADVRLYKKINDKFESISERTPSETDTKIRELIKISHKAFTYSVLFRQADLTGLTSVSDPKKRKEILKEPLNLIIYSKLEDIASKKNIPIKKELNQIDGSISIIGNTDEDIKKAKTEIINRQKEVEEEKIHIKTNENSIKKTREIINQLKQSLGQNDLEIHNKVSQQENILNKLIENSKKYNNKIEEIKTKINNTKEIIIDINSKLTNCQEKLNQINLKSIENIEELQIKFDKVCADEIKGSEIIAGVKADIRTAKLTIPDSDKCQTCHQSISQEYRNKIQIDVNSKLKKFTKDLEYLEITMSKCKIKKNKLEIALKESQKRLLDISKIENDIKLFTNNQKIKNETLELDYNNQTEILRQLKENDCQITDINKQLEILKETADKSDALVINNKIFSLENEIIRLQKNTDSHNLMITNISGIIGGFEERINTRLIDKEKLKILLGKKESLTHELNMRQMVVDAFSSKGIPTFIIQTILDDLQFEVNKAIKELRPELNIQIDSELNIVYSRNGILREYEQLSHGQHVYIALAFKRALSIVIQKRLNIDIKLLEFDEVDAHLDEEGVNAFSDAIIKWEKDFVIFVITHNKDLKDKFSHIILVEENEDGSEGKLTTTY